MRPDFAMASLQAQRNAEATATQADGGRATEIAQDLESLRMLAARFRHLAPTAQGRVLRVILGKREALLESISARLARPKDSGERADAGAALETARVPKSAFAQALGEVMALDRESEGALRKRCEEAAAGIQKLRAGIKWRQSNSR